MSQVVDLVVRGGLIVSAESTTRASVAISKGRVVAIGDEASMPSAREMIDAAGKHVLPGAIDVHVHFRDPGMTYKEDWATGTAAAAVGGVTTVFDMPNTDPPTATIDGLRIKQHIARQRAHVDYGIYGVLDASSLPHLEALVDGGVIGFKCFMAESTGELPSPCDGTIFEGLQRLAPLGVRTSFHAENAAIIARLRARLQVDGRTDAHAHLASRPSICAIEAVGRAIALAEAARAPIHIAHKSSKEALQIIRQARWRGIDVTAETCPQYLLLDTRDVDRLGGQLRANPPIRGPGHAEGLWHGLHDGSIDMIATDHAPHDPKEKLCDNIWDCARGIPGVETQMPLLLTEVNAGRMTINDYVRWSAENPAKVWKLYPRKGIIAVGSDADIVIVDMDREGHIDQAKLHSRHKWTPWHGRPIKGMPVLTLVRGRVVARNGHMVGEPGSGQPVVGPRCRHANAA